ncbi:MAG: ABC transporter transmembrane domain-containing protein, partial [Candidatus Cloacimonadaceae bacterium]
MLILVDVIQLIMPKVMQYAIDSLQARTIDQKGLFWVAMLIVAGALSMMALRYFWRILIIGNSHKIERQLRQDFYDHLMSLSQNFFNKSKIGDLMAYATNDLNAVRMLFGMGLIAAMDIVLMTLASFSFMGTINWKLTVLAVLPMPLLPLAMGTFGKKMHVAFRKVQASFASMSGAIQESISGIRVVKAFAQEEAELAKVDDVSMNFVKRNISLARITGIFHPFMNFVINISVIITLFFGGRAAIRGEITIGEFIAFFQYLGMLVWPMMAIGWLVDMYQRGTASLQRLNDIFVLKPEITDANADQSITEIQGAIEFKNLSFRYDESLPWVLKDISAGIDSGQTLAIVGPTGCGKTTLIELIARIYEPPEGSILIDGIPVDRIPLQTLRQEIVLVPQDIFLFSESLADNIRLADVNASMEQV